MRLFVSVDLPGSLATPLREVQRAFAAVDGLDPVDPTDAHVTLAFLGEVASEEYDDVRRALERGVAAAGVAPFDATVEGVGAFPSAERPRVLWVGVGDGASELGRLHGALAEAFAEAGLAPDDRPFTPHVTVARVRDDSGGAGDALAGLRREREPRVGTVRVEDVRLTESVTDETGRRYETRETVALA